MPIVIERGRFSATHPEELSVPRIAELLEDTPEADEIVIKTPSLCYREDHALGTPENLFKVHTVTIRVATPNAALWYFIEWLLLLSDRDVLRCFTLELGAGQGVMAINDFLHATNLLLTEPERTRIIVAQWGCDCPGQAIGFYRDDGIFSVCFSYVGHDYEYVGERIRDTNIMDLVTHGIHVRRGHSITIQPRGCLDIDWEPRYLDYNIGDLEVDMQLLFLDNNVLNS